MNFDCEGDFVGGAQGVLPAAGLDFGLSQALTPHLLVGDWLLLVTLLSPVSISCSQGVGPTHTGAQNKALLSQKLPRRASFHSEGGWAVFSSRVLGPNRLDSGRGDEEGQSPFHPKFMSFLLNRSLNPCRWPVAEAVSL